MSDTIYYKDELVDVENYLLYPLVSATVILDKDKFAYFNLSNKEYNINFVKTEKNTMYYLGKYNVCEKFANKKPHDFFHYFSKFQHDVLDIYKSLESKDYEAIVMKEKDFLLHYLNYFEFL
jgi:hypothetical protein